MKKRSLFAPFALALLACGGNEPPPAAAPTPVTAPPTPAPTAVAPAPAPTVTLPAWAAQYPASRTVDAKDVLFGTEVRDPYRWLEDPSTPEVQAWVKAQDDLTRAKLAKLPEREAIAARLKELFYVDSRSIPQVRGSRFFYEQRTGAQEKWVVYWREGEKGKEHVLLDPNAWSTDGSKSLHDWSISWDGTKVAYAVSENNADEATLHLMDVASGKESKVDVIPGAKYAHASWTPKGDGFYYVRVPVDPSIPVDQRPGYADVRFHPLGADPAKDALVRERTGDPATFVNGWISRDGKLLFSEVDRGWNANDLWMRDPSSKTATWTPLTVGKDALHNLEEYKGKIYLATNDGAPRWRVVVVDPKSPDQASWKEIVPERKDATLDSMQILGGKLVLTYLKDVVSHVEVHDLDGKLVREVPLPGIGSAAIAGEPDRDQAFYSFASYDRPVSIHTTSIAHGGDTVWFAAKVPVDPSKVTVEQVFFNSKDGTRVPMFVVRGKDTPKDGSAPAILNGYGGFNVSMTPAFRKSIYPWIERGGVYAIVNLRGGGEYGEAWHRAGMKHTKQNVFDDFEGAAAFLASEKYTSADKLAIDGASNGGLLVGAALTQRPDLFRVALCGVPLLDMVRYEKFGSGRTWSPEYGTVSDEADFRTLYAYSPYHHVTPGTRYPSVLFDSADSDDRVDPMHARKLAAELQASSTGGSVLLRIERHSGHGGADQLKSWVDEIADQYAFALAEIKQPGSALQ